MWGSLHVEIHFAEPREPGGLAMTEKQLKLIYADACSAVGRVPDKAQSVAWLAVLGSFEEADVRAALVTWWGDTALVPSGSGFRTRGSVMPAASDLKAMVLDALRKDREARRFQPCSRRTTDDSGKEFTCDKGDLWTREPGSYWERAGKCLCHVKWEQTNGKVVAA